MQELTGLIVMRLLTYLDKSVPALPSIKDELLSELKTQNDCCNRQGYRKSEEVARQV